MMDIEVEDFELEDDFNDDDQEFEEPEPVVQAVPVVPDPSEDNEEFIIRKGAVHVDELLKLWDELQAAFLRAKSTGRYGEYVITSERIFIQGGRHRGAAEAYRVSLAQAVKEARKKG